MLTFSFFPRPHGPACTYLSNLESAPFWTGLCLSMKRFCIRLIYAVLVTVLSLFIHDQRVAIPSVRTEMFSSSRKRKSILSRFWNQNRCLRGLKFETNFNKKHTDHRFLLFTFVHLTCHWMHFAPMMNEGPDKRHTFRTVSHKHLIFTFTPSEIPSSQWIISNNEHFTTLQLPFHPSKTITILQLIYRLCWLLFAFVLKIMSELFYLTNSHLSTHLTFWI